MDLVTIAGSIPGGRVDEHAPATARYAVLDGGGARPQCLVAGRAGTVLDWTAAIVATPAYDVAATWLLLRHPPLVAPAALRPAIGAGGAVLARRFVRSYRRAAPAAPLGDIEWYVGLHAVRVLLDLARWRRDGDARAEHHPWRLVAGGAADALQRASGVRVDPAVPIG
jgi:hypothetical protein